jgi:Domain of unknown function (DUF1995)
VYLSNVLLLGLLTTDTSSASYKYGVVGFSITTTRVHASPRVTCTSNIFRISSNHERKSYVQVSATRRTNDIISDIRKQQSRQSLSLQMIFSGGSSTTTKVPTLPRDVKEAVTKCREATQRALQDRISRMDIDFPVGTKFGVEKIKKQSKQQKSTKAEDNKPTKDDFDTSDRELARIFVEMFQPVGSDKIVVTFNDVVLADLAKEQWKSELSSTTSKTNSYLCNVLPLDRRSTSTSKASKKLSKNEKNKNKAKGFAARMAELEVVEDDTTITAETSLNSSGGQFTLPIGTEVAIFVSPGQKEIPIIEKICNIVGMETLIILLNFRKNTITNFGSIEASNLFLNNFNTIFSLGAVSPQSIAPGCLLYHTYSSNQQDNDQQWIVARKPNVGQPKTILVTKNRPTDNEIQTAYNNLQLSDIEKNVETALDNVSKWFR